LNVGLQWFKINLATRARTRRKSRRVACCFVIGWFRMAQNLRRSSTLLSFLHQANDTFQSIYFGESRSSFGAHGGANVCLFLVFLMWVSRCIWRVQQLRPTTTYLQRRTSWTSHILPLWKSWRESLTVIQSAKMPERSSKDPLVWVDCEVSLAIYERRLLR
jgi:hypothetical protein